MTVQEHFLKSGTFLFRWRSYLPLALFPVLLTGLNGFGYPAGSHLLDLLWEILCLCIGFAGLCIRAFTVGCAPACTSGRGTRLIAESLNTTGMYSIVRHPIYLGNYFMWLGVAMLPRTWWLPAMATLAFWLYYALMIFVEEEFLRQKFGQAFLTWAQETPTFIPALTKWKRPALPFSTRAALKHEYHGLFALVVTFSLFEALADVVVTGGLRVDPFWAVTFGCTALTYSAVRFLAKRTRFLEVTGR